MMRIVLIFILLQRRVGGTACRCAVGRIAISQRVRGRCNLNPAVIERSIGVRWRGGGITAAAEVVYMIRGWFAIAVLWPWWRSKNGRSRNFLYLETFVRGDSRGIALPMYLEVPNQYILPR